MVQQTMYPVMDGSPKALTTGDVTAEDTQVYVDHLEYFNDAPNIANFIASDTTWERCVYSAKSAPSGAGYLTIARSGTGWASSTGSAQSWATGTKIRNVLTGLHVNRMVNNITDHESRLSAAETKLPSSGTDNAIVRQDGTTGATQSSLVTIDDAGSINIPTGQTFKINGTAHTHTASGITSGTLDKARCPQIAQRSIILLGSTAEVPSSNGGAADTVTASSNGQIIAGTKFAAGASDLYAQWRFRLPNNYDSAGGFKFKVGFLLKSASAASTNVIFGLQSLIVGHNGGIDSSWGSAVEIETDVSSIGANVLQISAESANAVFPAVVPSGYTVVGGEEVIFRIYRKGSDTSAADVLLTDVYMTYTTDNYEDA